MLFLFIATFASVASAADAGINVNYDKERNVITASAVSEAAFADHDGIFRITCSRSLQLDKYELYKKRVDKYGIAPACLLITASSGKSPYYIAQKLLYVAGDNREGHLQVIKRDSVYDRGCIVSSGLSSIEKGSPLFRAITEDQPIVFIVLFDNKPDFIFNLNNYAISAFREVLNFDMIDEAEKKIWY